MAGPAKNEVLEGLIRLQGVDHEISRIRRRLEHGPQLVERRTEGLRAAEQRLAEAGERIKRAKAKGADQELELRIKEGEIEKLASQQNSARTNQEYRAFGDHMDRLRKECAPIEDLILENFAQVEEAEEEERILAQARDEQAGEAKKIQGSWQSDEDEYKQELDVILKRRAEHVQSLPKGPYHTYQKVLQAYEGKAVVPLEGKVCSGCHMAITLNDVARLRGDIPDLVLCRSCGRILYAPEQHQAHS
jgi:hypothetical protein